MQVSSTASAPACTFQSLGLNAGCVQDFSTFGEVNWQCWVTEVKFGVASPQPLPHWLRSWAFSPVSIRLLHQGGSGQTQGSTWGHHSHLGQHNAGLPASQWLHSPQLRFRDHTPSMGRQQPVLLLPAWYWPHNREGEGHVKVSALCAAPMCLASMGFELWAWGGWQGPARFTAGTRVRPPNRLQAALGTTQKTGKRRDLKGGPGLPGIGVCRAGAGMRPPLNPGRAPWQRGGR